MARFLLRKQLLFQNQPEKKKFGMRLIGGEETG
jgi:hypothetical protein